MHGMHSMNSDDFELSPSTLSSFQTGSPCGYLPWWLDWLDTSAFCSRDSECSEKLPGLTLDFVMFIWALGCAANLQPCDEQWVLLHKVKRVALMRRACLFTWDILITGPKSQSPCRKGVRTLHPLHNNSHQNCQECCDFLWGSANVGETTCIILFCGSKEEKVLGQPRVRLIPLLMNSLRSEWWNTMEYYEIQFLLPCLARCFASDRGEGHKIQTTCNKYQGTCMNLYSCGLR